MAKQKIDELSRAETENEVARKEVRRLKRKERELGEIVVVEEGNIATAVAVIRSRATHINAHCQEIRDELATYTDEDITGAEDVCTVLEGEADGDLANFPVGWPDV